MNSKDSQCFCSILTSPHFVRSLFWLFFILTVASTLYAVAELVFGFKPFDFDRTYWFFQPDLAIAEFVRRFSVISLLPLTFLAGRQKRILLVLGLWACVGRLIYFLLPRF
jgi:hypothetical protein